MLFVQIFLSLLFTEFVLYIIHNHYNCN